MNIMKKRGIAAGLLAVGFFSAWAQALETENVLPGDWLIRVRGINVSPNDSSSPVTVPALGGAVPGSSVGVDSGSAPELDITYMLSPNWGVELILGTSQHDVNPEGSILQGALNGIAPAGRGGEDIIDLWVLPPTVTLQYHFLPQSSFRPYAGLGLNYSIFHNEEVTGALAAPGATVNLRPSFGWAAQVGIDFDLGAGWFGNVDVKYIDINTTAEFRGTSVGDASVNVDINPTVFGIGIGRRF